ncbi:hypothetical protein M7I_6822 [Glarea lozoyensis 74030]|uniref:Subtilisin-like protein n=1 Tax=Glarea lozoyensis (strain ATCC 74030 / MF5533) TaxID=1104152 RepID=H0EVM3_GLAL7|nr:hypothetical protein M7I_6822 [Glarea lozoyensis 74030]
MSELGDRDAFYAELGNYTTCLSEPYHSMCQLDMAATATITEMPEVSLTTDENGQETEVPIISCPPPWCPLAIAGGGAGVIGGGVVAALALKNFPPTPNRQFDLKGVPPFRIPCVPIPVVRPCNCPPGPPPNPGTVPDPPPPYPGTDPAKPEEPSQEEPDDEKKSTKSDDEECTKTTVSDCTTIYNVAVTGSKRDLVTSTMTTTSCGPAITACDRTARNTEITTSSVDIDAPFEAVQEFTERLKREIGVETLWTSGSELGKFVVFWSGNLTSDQAEAYKADPLTKSSLERRADPGTPSSFLPTSGQLRQQDAVDELKVFCQPAGVELKDIKGYVYRMSRPYSSRIYILDTGADTSSQTYQNLDPERVEWLHPGGTEVKQGNEPFQIESDANNDAKPSFHGTQVLSKAVNEPYGVGRGVDVTINVGSVDNSGTRLAEQPFRRWFRLFENAKVDIYAPGSTMSVSGSNGATLQAAGSSYAAPAVAGLISYFYNSPHLEVITQKWKYKGGSNLDWTRTVKEYVIELSYERVPGQDGGPVNVVYNGEDPAESCPVPGSSGDGVSRRQNDESEVAKPCLVLYRINTNRKMPWDIVEAFDKRLKRETNEASLYKSGYWGDKTPGGRKFMFYWQQYLTTEQVESYKKDPATYRNIPPNHINWIFAGIGVEQELDDFVDDLGIADESVKGAVAHTIFHGTFVLSKAVEEPFGVGRGTNVTIVRLPRPFRTRDEEIARTLPSDRVKLIANALQLVYWDILEKGASFRSVINLSRTIDGSALPSTWHEDPHSQFYGWLKELADLGVVIVVPAGGDADPNAEDKEDTQTMRSIPSVWATSPNDEWAPHDLPLIVVGACDRNGKRYPKQPYRPWPGRWRSEVDVYAPAMASWVAGPSPGRSARRRLTGAAYAAPQVAGLVTYFFNSEHLDVMTETWVARGSVPLDWPRIVRNYVRNLAYDRQPEGDRDAQFPVKVIYNGENPRQWFCALPGGSGSVSRDLDGQQGGDSSSCASYRITPKMDVPWDIVEAFAKRLQDETDKDGLYISGSSEYQLIAFWQLNLTPEQVQKYKEDPATLKLFVNPKASL